VLILFPSIDEFEVGESGAQIVVDHSMVGFHNFEREFGPLSSMRRLIPRVILSRSGAEAKNPYDES
jgi:hypothetical protein